MSTSANMTATDPGDGGNLPPSHWVYGTDVVFTPGSIVRITCVADVGVSNADGAWVHEFDLYDYNGPVTGTITATFTGKPPVGYQIVLSQDASGNAVASDLADVSGNLPDHDTTQSWCVGFD